MLYELFYYTLTTALVSTTAFGIYYICDPRAANKLAVNISWRTVNYYIRARSMIEEFNERVEAINRQSINNTDNESGDEEEKESLIEKKSENLIVVDKDGVKFYTTLDSLMKEYGVEEDSSDDSSDVDEEGDSEETKKEDSILSNFNDAFKIIFKIHNDEPKNIYRRMLFSELKNNIVIEKSKKPFIQVELKVDDKTVDLQKYLQQYYLVGNKILDKEFLKWIISENRINDINVEAIENDNYKINIIDKDVEMFELSNNQYILIKDINGSYDKI